MRSKLSRRRKIVTLLYSVAVTSKGTCGLVVPTQYGAVRGDTEGHVFAFCGIRFAAPPIGSLRFHPPTPPQGLERRSAGTGAGQVSIFLSVNIE